MSARIRAYYWSPYAPLSAEHVLVVFDIEDSDGSFLSYSPVEGVCRLNYENSKLWRTLSLSDFVDALGDVYVPRVLLAGVGSKVENIKEKCYEWSVKHGVQRDT